MSFQPQSTHERSMAKYRRKASRYDSTTKGTDSIRTLTVALLALKEGETVLDVGCGSAVSVPLLLEGVGKSGRVFGFDQSLEMFQLAQRKAVERGWPNVHLQHGSAESLQLSAPLDALLFHYTHDILQSEQAVDNLLSLARPGARVAVAGMKNFPLWTGPLLALSFAKNFAWNGNPRGLNKPWRHLAARLESFTYISTHAGMGYMGVGQLA